MRKDVANGSFLVGVAVTHLTNFVEMMSVELQEHREHTRRGGAGGCEVAFSHARKALRIAMGLPLSCG